ncbi:leucine/isoleucine/valine transporter subunit; ATP-binding component of ABC superfamily [Mesorhizobium plurifarium]|uniref:Leucine/isoleucine/valine transporter subunit ATP-binding component of ABC superfamily n=1 Tax=Mesorhizobium plurifarium TaxID=69974 RepID=A0A090EUM3_MESPL|nr:leucine/isoleucine/valine transporter subunit; ATP-binding component of ABC superfamily [Mesorhizobium sp. SOD10]CDX35320.1 leucine/isoleucine/valine transporter subunit; ATP-binding component of ABC superfamily [Mesorhizobium plurifarium]
MSTIETKGLTAYYGDFQALFGVDIILRDGETTAIIGANGAGKSTVMKAITGLIKTSPEMVFIDGAPCGGREAHTAIASGIAMVPEGRRLFPSLTVEENLLLGAHCARKGPWTLERVYEVFPGLKERRRLSGTALSGGQQQMVAIGRALMSNPTSLLCDEISLGLAPVIIEDLYRNIAKLKEEGLSIVIVEQDLVRAVSVADRVYCLMEGRVSLEGRADEMSLAAIRNAYFGV